MYRFLQYTLLFLMAVALQIFLFDNLQLSLYVHPLIYLVFILLLPMETDPYLLLLLALPTGMVADLFSGMPAMNTIATVFIAFCRPGVLRLFAGREVVQEGGAPNAAKLGAGKFLRYSFTLILLHGILFFSLETLTMTGFGYTLFRIAISAVCTTLAVWFFQLLFSLNPSRNR
jgi:hypothetical protein